MLRIVEPVDVVAGFRQEMRMSSLSAWHIENSRSGRQAEDVDQARDFLSVALEFEDRLVFEEVVGVEVRLPPFAFPAQKKTGSR